MENNGHAQKRGGDVIKGLAAGMIGGLVAAAAMNQFQKLVGKFLIGEERSHGAQSLQQGSPEHGIGRELQERGKDDPDDDAAERLANALSVALFDRELTESEKEIAGTAFHYGYGISMGAVYGATAEVLPEATLGAGLPYGALIWAGADEGVVPLLGLSKLPSAVSAFDPRFGAGVASCLRRYFGSGPARGAKYFVKTMHELSIAMSMVDMASEKAAEMGGAKVSALYLNWAAFPAWSKTPCFFPGRSPAKGRRSKARRW